MRSKISFSRVLSLSVLVLFAASQAVGYTLVLRSGRRLQVSDNVIVSGQSVVCEMGNDVNLSFQLAAVDIAATERANHEAPGTFLRKGTKASVVKPTVLGGAPARPSVTNADLEVFRRRRIASEQAYEAQRKKLGLPSAEELRLRSNEQAEEASRTSQSLLARQETQEEYWRGRSSSLRSEISANEAQIQYLEDRLNELPNSGTNNFSGVSSFPVVIGSRTNVGPVFFPGPHVIPQVAPIYNPRIIGGGRSRVRIVNRPYRYRGAQPFGLPLGYYGQP